MGEHDWPDYAVNVKDGLECEARSSWLKSGILATMLAYAGFVLPEVHEVQNGSSDTMNG